jgi:hypothetical protein
MATTFTNGWEYGGLRIEAVENGFIIYSGSEKWVFTSLTSALKFIEKSFSKNTDKE